MADFYVKRNDTGPPVPATLEDANGVPVNLTGISGVKFHMRNAVLGTLKVNAPCTVVTAASGTVRYDWAVGDTSVSGLYKVEFEVDFGGNLIESFPNDSHLTLQVTDDLA